MKNGGNCDLLKYLSAEPKFGLKQEEMEKLLCPSLYIGRCAEQVDNFLNEVKPLIANVQRTTAEISL